MGAVRDLAALPKAHLHLHLTGSMRLATVLDLAERQGRRLPPALVDVEQAALTSVALRGWYRFQRLYDAARDLLEGEEEVRRVVAELVEDQAREGVGWVELQVDPTTYAPRLGGLQAVVEAVLDELRAAGERHGVGTALVVAANRTRHPADAEALARVARRFAGRGVVAFGLSNDETRGTTEDFGKAFRIARDAGLVGVPHAGELRGAGHVERVVRALEPVRLGHGVRAVEDDRVLEVLAERQIACEVCPASNLALGVYRSLEEVPVRRLREAGVLVALGADDPLVFRSGLVDQYAALRGLGWSDDELADLAGCSVRASLAPSDVRARLLDAVAAWLR